MRLRIAERITRLFFGLTGGALIVLGVFAYALGLDNDPGWGTGRTLMTAAGLVSLLTAAALMQQNWTRRALHVVSAGLRAPGARLVDAFHARFGRSPLLQKLQNIAERRADLFAVSGALVCMFVGLWFISAGRLFFWMPATHYFDQLADGFLAGQLSLLERPSPELLAMPNPYDWRARLEQDVSVLWDATLYEGRYYLYWGPVPALLAAGVKAVIPARVSDAAPLYFFYCGTIFFSTLTLAHLRRVYFPRSAAWLLLPFTLLAGLSAPLMWLVNRPSVYETAIAGGQFFLMIGLYAALRALRSSTAAGWLLTAGLAWGAAVSCRLNLALAVAVFSLALVYYFLKTGSRRRLAARLLFLGVPLLLWAAGLGGYNHARFGSVLETGHRYQLTGPALPDQYEEVTSIKYALPSLYSYLLRPPSVTPDAFPFVSIPFVSERMWPFFIRLPEHYYYSEPVAGLITTTPALLLSALPLLGWLRRFWRWLREQPAPPRAAEPALAAVWMLLAGGGAALFLPLLIFISTSLRYLADVLPITACLAAFSLWWGLEFFADRPFARRMLTLTALALVLWGVLLGVLSGFSAGDVPFELRNPDLYQRLQSFFG